MQERTQQPIILFSNRNRFYGKFMSMHSIRRVKRSKATAQAAYNRLSHWYDWLAAAERPFRGQGTTLLNPQLGEQVLEIGCGTGTSLLTLAQAVGKQGDIHGLDLSPGMLTVANGRMAAAGLNKLVTLTCGDAAHLPYADHSFDAVFMSFTLELFDTPELPLALAEVKRVLVANGRFCVVALSKENAGLITRLYEVFHAYLPAYVDCRPIFVQHLLAEHGFQVSNGRQTSMFGLPIEIILATNNPLNP